MRAELKSLTRVNGVSPETVYFSAQGSTCSNCGDIFGLGTQLATAYSEFAYYFDFDDNNSGNFATTGNSRNQQVSSSPRAIHTFECSGTDDPNWNNVSERCEFNVGVRVQAKDGENDDAFIRINIQPLYGTGGYYADSNIYCVSNDPDSDFSGCPHDDSSRHLTNTPAIGNWDGNLVLFENGSTQQYDNICMGADEQHATAATYGTGERPLVGRILLSSRPGSCNESFGNDANISMLNHPERDANGHLIDGFAFNQTVTGLRVGSVSNGHSFTLLNYHDLDMDWSEDASANGEFKMINAAFACRTNDNLSCSNIPYASFLFLTDSVIKSSLSNLATPVNIGCFNGCGAVNFGFAGVEVGTANEHNIRIQGAWGLVLSNNYFRGNHIGGTGPKSGVTLRPIDSDCCSGGLHDLDKNPEVLTTAEYLRGEGSSTDFTNHFNVGIDNLFNEPEQDPLSSLTSRFSFSGFYTAEYGTIYQEITLGDCGDQSSLHLGLYRTVRNITWNPCAFDVGVGGLYDDFSERNDSRTVHIEGSFSGTAGSYNGNTPVLSIPSAPGNK